MSRRRQSVSPLGPGENPFADVALRYAHDLLAAIDIKKLEIGIVQRILRCDLMDEIGPAETGLVRLGKRESDSPPRTDLRKRIASWKLHAKDPAPPRKPVGGFVGANLALISTLFSFDETDRELFEFVVVLRSSPVLKELAEAFGYVSLSAVAALVTAATSMRSTVVLQAIRRGRAARSGLLKVNESETRDFADRLELKDGVLDLVLTPGLDRDAILSRFLPASPPSTLAWSDFAAVQEGAGVVREPIGNPTGQRRWRASAPGDRSPEAPALALPSPGTLRDALHAAAPIGPGTELAGWPSRSGARLMPGCSRRTRGGRARGANMRGRAPRGR